LSETIFLSSLNLMGVSIGTRIACLR